MSPVLGHVLAVRILVQENSLLRPCLFERHSLLSKVIEGEEIVDLLLEIATDVSLSHY